jgi:hypothetical protein
VRAEIDYNAATQRVTIYLGGTDVAFFRDENGVMNLMTLKPGDERPAFVRWEREVYEAIADAILLRESPRHADPALLREMLDDTRETRDRVLTMLERG